MRRVGASFGHSPVARSIGGWYGTAWWWSRRRRGGDRAGGRHGRQGPHPAGRAGRDARVGRQRPRRRVDHAVHGLGADTRPGPPGHERAPRPGARNHDRRQQHPLLRDRLRPAPRDVPPLRHRALRGARGGEGGAALRAPGRRADRPGGDTGDGERAGPRLRLAPAAEARLSGEVQGRLRPVHRRVPPRREVDRPDGGRRGRCPRGAPDHPRPRHQGAGRGRRGGGGRVSPRGFRQAPSMPIAS